MTPTDRPAEDGSSPKRQRFESPPPMCIDPSKRYNAEIVTSKGTMMVALDPASAPRRSRALAALCDQLTATETIYPDTQMKIEYSVKGHRGTS